MGAVSVGTADYVSFRGVDFKVTRSGNLECQSCPSAPIWCEHQAEMINANADAEQLWEFMDQDLGDYEFEIPIFPTLNMWGHVYMGSQMKVGARKLFFAPPPEAITHANEMIFIGFIHPSEGRTVIRSMILDWFTGWAREEDLQCRSTGHSVRQQFQWEKMMTTNKRTANLWSVWVSKACPACQIQDWSDLIPDVDPPRSPFNG